jgi:hypothetical protein
MKIIRTSRIVEYAEYSAFVYSSAALKMTNTVRMKYSVFTNYVRMRETGSSETSIHVYHNSRPLIQEENYVSGCGDRTLKPLNK